MMDNPAPTIQPDLGGPHYWSTLSRLHEVLAPKSYFEIGSLHGDTLALARCATLAVDPAFDFSKPELIGGIMTKPQLQLFQMPSDDFFAAHDPVALLGRTIDLAFLDGMHRCEFLLRDFINTERSCTPNSVVMLHDCLPVETGMAARTPTGAPAEAPHRTGWWTGDVWRTALLLKRRRPDLSITAIDANPTGLVLVSNLDPHSTVLRDGYAADVRAMMGWDLAEIGIPALFEELQVEPEANLLTHEQITARFWL